MRVRVDAEKCQGHTLCAWVAPAVIQLGDDDGHARIDDPNVPPAHEQAVRDAVGNCPEGALILEE